MKKFFWILVFTLAAMLSMYLAFLFFQGQVLAKRSELSAFFSFISGWAFVKAIVISCEKKGEKMTVNLSRCICTAAVLNAGSETAIFCRVKPGEKVKLVKFKDTQTPGQTCLSWNGGNEEPKIEVVEDGIFITLNQPGDRIQVADKFYLEKSNAGQNLILCCTNQL